MSLLCICIMYVLEYLFTLGGLVCKLHTELRLESIGNKQAGAFNQTDHLGGVKKQKNKTKA